jgi:3',5'-cyclic AMP phosphodiesterase CpdA
LSGSGLHGSIALVKTGDAFGATNSTFDGTEAVTAFTLAHLSDPHLAPLPRPGATELFGKRALGYINWVQNRRRHHSRAVVDQLTADVRAQAPDHIAVTGDLVNIALDAEFAPACDWLKTIGSPHDVTLVPGNHDAYVGSTWPRCAASWQPYMRGDDGNDAMPPRFPYLRRRGPLLLFCVSTAVPTAPFMATGWLGTQQIRDLTALLAQHEAEKAYRVLLIHHPLRSQRWHKRLTDADDLLALLRWRGVNLILHGHDHKHSLMWFDGPSGLIPAVGVPSASAVIDGRHDAAAYNLFRIANDSDGWGCHWTVRGFDKPEHGITELRAQELL